MSSAGYVHVDTQTHFKSRKAIIGDHPSIFADIYQQYINIAVWQRELSDELDTCVNKFLKTHSNYQKTLIITPDDAYSKLIKADDLLGNFEALSKDIAELVEMFCLLFETKRVGLRMATLDRAMCPRFHVDKVVCRLVCTYHGVATEWLTQDKVDRSKLGRGNNGLEDEKSGIYQSEQDINQLTIGDVAMLKGELWQGNDNAGLVHRSPAPSKDSKRLLLTIDFYE